MPAAKEYPYENTNLWRELRPIADEELKNRSKLHKMHVDYYYGDQPGHLKDDKNNIVINVTKQTVDRTVAFAVPEFPHIVLPENGDTTTADGLWSIWRMNGGANLLAMLFYFGSFDGQVFLRADMQENKRIRLIPYTSEQIIVFWDSEDLDRVLWYEIHWQAGKTHWRQDIINEGDRWLIRDYRKEGSRWVLDLETVWPYMRAPIQDTSHLPNLRRDYYGAHEFYSMNLQNNINGVSSDLRSILRNHAYPKTIATGTEANQVQAAGIDNFWAIPDKDAKVQNLEMQSDLVSSMAFLEFLTNNFLRESRVTMLPLDVGGLRATTNLGIKAVFADQTAKTRFLQQQYGNLIKNINALILEVGNQNPEQSQDLKWRTGLPEGALEKTQVINQQMMLGLLSPQTASANLGLNYDDEQNRIDEAEIVNQRLIEGAGVNPNNP